MQIYFIMYRRRNWLEVLLIKRICSIIMSLLFDIAMTMFCVV